MLKLTNIPQFIQDKLLDEYIDIKKKYFLGDWSSGQLKSGRFGEVIIRIFQILLNEPHTPFGNNISSSEKTRIINNVVSSKNIDMHIRQKVTSLTRLLLDFRNNRDSAHLGGFNANHMDAYFTMSAANWIIAELIRVYSGLSMDKVEEIISEITIKDFPLIINIEGDQFISSPNFTSKQETLILLYHNPKGLEYNFIFKKTKNKNTTEFKRQLNKMVKDKLIVEKKQKYFIMPEGIRVVESLVRNKLR